MITILTNIDALLASIEADVTAFVVEGEQVFEKVTESIADDFRKDVSGRRPDDMGLNIRTGTLLASIQSGAARAGHSFLSIIWNKGADYWYYHEIGAGFNPKRLDWFSYWETKAQARYETAADNLLGRLA